MQAILHERDFLEYSLLLIEKQCEWGRRENWKNSNFEELSFRILRVSGIRISPGTLKRVFGKVKTQKGYQPQQATKDAFAIFLGFKEWNEFKERSKSELSPVERPFLNQKNAHKNKKESVRGKVFTLFGVSAICVLILVYFMLKERTKAEEVSFLGKHLVGRAYHTAVFNYNISESHHDFYIDFGDDQKHKLDKRLKTISHYYMLPDIYRVNFYSEDKALMRDTFVYITTQGWEAFANEIKEEIRYYPINKFSIIEQNKLSVTPDKVMFSGVDTNTIFWVHFCNVKPFGMSGDDFILETVVRNRPEVTQVRCNHIRIDIIGEHGRHALYFVKPGCAKWVNLQFSEIELDGVNNDFIEFSRDFSEWKNVKFEVNKQKAEVYYENELIYNITYKKSIGNIMGIRYSFTGYGEVDEVTLYDKDRNVKYNEGF